MLSIITAMDSLGMIGKENAPKGIPWHLPSDMARFKKLTLGKKVLVGYKTFQLMGILRDRTMFVLTKTHAKEVAAKGICAVSSLATFRKEVEKDDEVFVLGGAEIYRLCLPFATHFHVTYVHQMAGDGATKFPLDAWMYEEWKLEYSSGQMPVKHDPEDGAATRYEHYVRKK